MNLTATIGDDKKSYQIALSRPALTITVEWTAEEAVKSFAIVVTNSGNGPAHLGRLELSVDDQPLATRVRGDYDVIARKLFDQHWIGRCGGLVTFGDYWLCAGARQALFQVTLNPVFPNERMPMITARLNASIQYGSLIPNAPPNRAWLRPPATSESSVVRAEIETMSAELLCSSPQTVSRIHEPPPEKPSTERFRSCTSTPS